MIRLLSLVTLLFCISLSPAEAQFLKKLKKNAEQAAEDAVMRKTREKTRKKVEGTIDDATDGKSNSKDNNAQGTSATDDARGNLEDKDGPSTNQPTTTGQTTTQEANDLTEAESFEVYSKYDFVAGEKVIHYENFERAEIGDFPTGWNTLTSAEVVSTNGIEGKWLKLSESTQGLVPYQFTEFPENFTFEFDMIYFTHDDYAYQRNLNVIFTDIADPEVRLNTWSPGKNTLKFGFQGGVTQFNSSSNMYKRKEGSDQTSSTGNDIKAHINAAGIGNPVHVSMWKQGSRFRVYLDEEKIYDIPLAWNMTVPIGAVRFLSEISREDEYYLISNLRLAVGKPDMRSKLITEGKLVTYGITFETNSDVVKASSHGTLKKIAQVLNENPDVQVLITGHTDADGQDDYNMELSSKRAMSVKSALVTHFAVSSDQLQTAGAGESKPIGDNSTPEGKAQNRRVEFTKM